MGEAGVWVEGQAESYSAAISALSRCKPDVIVLDCRLPDMRTTEAISEFAGVAPGARFVVLNDADDRQYQEAAASKGASCVRKDRVATDLVAAIQWAGRQPDKPIPRGLDGPIVGQGRA